MGEINSERVWRESLQCVECKGSLSAHTDQLKCSSCARTFKVELEIPRFVKYENYTHNFGLQWKRFASTQLDSANGMNRSARRFQRETNMNIADLEDLIVLDAGCGAGRFLELLKGDYSKKFGVDMSLAVEIAKENNPKVNIIQADISRLPFSDNYFDVVYSIGVIHHTSEPKSVLRELTRVLRDGGILSLCFYENYRWYTQLYSKYLIRPITKRLPSRLLMRIIEISSYVWFPLSSLLFKLPLSIGKFFQFVIPVANYVDEDYSSKKSRKEEAILDTFDMLAPKYDKPLSRREIFQWLNSFGVTFQLLEVHSKKGALKFRIIKH